LVFLGPTAMAAQSSSSPEQVARGKYVFDAAGCAGCHTDTKNKGPFMAGGRALNTPFGVFYSPNITPDRQHGIGGWTEDDFRRALRDGEAPDGSPYFPVFPYSSYTLMNDRDVGDLWAYLRTLPPVARANTPHAANPPFGWRFLVPLWKALYFTPGSYQPDRRQDETWNRGAYVARALGHCGECHTPRDALGGFEPKMEFAGTTQGPEGGSIPNITPDRKTGIGRWSRDDLRTLLTEGMLPDADFVGDSMGEVVDNTTSRLSVPDLEALITYLRSRPPILHQVSKPKQPTKQDDW
jgi:mono/diheme cytochrome c family protein